MSQQKAANDIPFLKGFTRLAAYNIAAGLTVPLASLVDAAMLGRLPQVAALAGVALAGVLFDYVYWGFGFLRMGTTGLTAQALGAGRDDEANRILIRGVFLGVVLGAAVLILHPLLREGGFALLRGEADVEAAGRAYFNARIWGAPLTLANFALVGWFLGAARGRAVLLLTVVGSTANVAFNYLLILRLGYGPAGAGAGTALAQAIQFLVGLGLLPRGTLASAAGRLRTTFDWPVMARFLRLNGDLMVRTIFLISAFALFQNGAAQLGKVTLAADAILLHLLALAAYWIDGVAFATEVYSGRAHGAGDRALLRATLRASIALSLGFAALFSTVYWLFRVPIAGAISTHAEVVAQIVQFVPWLVLTLSIGSFAYALDGFFLGLTRSRLLRNAMAASFVVGFLPLSVMATRHQNNTLLWLSLVAFMIARTISLGFPAWKTAQGSIPG